MKMGMMAKAGSAKSPKMGGKAVGKKEKMMTGGIKAYTGNVKMKKSGGMMKMKKAK